MWHTQSKRVSSDTIRYQLFEDDTPLTHKQVLEYWQHNDEFRQHFNQMLNDAPFTAFRWEMPPLTAGKINQSFEFVLVDDPTLATASPDPTPFEGYFEPTESLQLTVTFSNLGGDATLIVPTPIAEQDCYPHLAAFARQGPEQQVHAFWQAVGGAVAQQLGSSPLWVSTAGTGVPWLHARLDRRPKYYCHEQYREMRV